MPITVEDVLRTFEGATVMPRVLREYQTDIVDRVRAEIQAGRRRVCLQLGTGGGKTDIAGYMFSEATKRGMSCLFVCHRLELIDNAVARLQLWGLTDVGVIRAADDRTNPAASVQVASIDSFRRRTKPKADLIIIDEAHRSLAQSYKALLDIYPDAVFVGLTGTPIRLNGDGLGDFYNALVCGPSWAEMFSLGALVKPRVFVAPAPPKLEGIKMQNGDYALGQTQLVMNDPTLAGNIVSEWQRLAEGRTTAVFASGVEHSISLCERFQAAGVAAAHVDGTTPEETRNRIFREWHSGNITVLCNFGVAVEGVDNVRCKCIVLARPTKSLTIYLQACGRALRPWNGVQPMVIDHAQCTDEHGLPFEDREWSLENKPRGPSVGLRICPACYAAVEPGLVECPYCGARLRDPSGRGVREEDERKLIELTEEMAERRPWDKLIASARNRGYKPGWATFQYIEKYGKDNPKMWAWFAEAKRAYAEDKEWQAAVVEQASKRAAWT